ncbi:MAG TPA: SCO family protein [Actinobacteria bacterium]|nr:SCO family protein [Actinomycetota bacterium]
MTRLETPAPADPAPPARRRRALLAVGIVVAVVLAAVVARSVVLPRLRPYAFHGTVIRSTEPVPAITLESATGPVSLDAFAGELVVLYFGYTYCPDVCPTTLAKLARTKELLGERAEEVNVVLVSVDPARDTPESLAEYVAHFDPDFLGLTADPATIDRIATIFGVYYARNGEGDDYLVDHTATTLVVDRDGYLKLVLPYEATAEEIAADLEYLLDH